MRSNDIVSYVLLYDDESGPQPRNCNKYPPGSGEPERRKHRRVSVYLDTDGGGDMPTRWCPGRWTAVAYVLRRRHTLYYAPRLMYAKKRFSIG